MKDQFRDFSPKEINLVQNWRSGPNIIQFNNAVFANASLQLDEMYKRESKEASGIIHRIYADAMQEPSGMKQQGFVSVSFVKDEEHASWEETVIHRIPVILENLQDKGFRLRDIAILVRTKKEGAAVADHLMQYRKEHSNSKYRYDVISDESVYLNSSVAVNFIMGIIKYLIDPGNAINKTTLLNYYMTCLTGTEVDPNSYLTNPEEQFQMHIAATLRGAGVSLSDMPLQELVECIVSLFRLNGLKDQLPFIQSFQDVVLEYTRRRGTDITSFSDWWTDEEDKQHLSICTDQDAVRILTIHKSKGLGFKNVIIPFCNWLLNDTKKKNIIWGKTPASDPVFSACHEQLPYIPLAYSGSLKDTYFNAEYRKEQQQMYIDNLNLLYVANTRACDSIFIFAPQPGKEIRSVGDLLYSAITKCADFPGTIDLKSHWNEGKNEFTYGSLMPSGQEKERSSNPVMLEQYPVNARIRGLRQKYSNREFFESGGGMTDGGVNYGILMHYVFAQIHSEADVDGVMKQVMLSGKIRSEDLERVEKDIISKIRMQDQSRSWFDGSWDEVRTESEIILPGNIIYRPDRVMIRGKKAVIVDFKFGDAGSEKDIKQVSKYAGFLEKMHYSPVEAYLWYYMKDEIVKVQ